MSTPTATPFSSVDDTDKGMAILAHISSLLASIFSVGILSFAGPLVMWFVAGGQRPFVRQAAAKSFNFNLGMCLLYIVGGIAAIAGLVGTFFTGPVGFAVMVAGLLAMGISIVLQFVCHILGTIAASQGREYNYPMRLRILPE